MKFFLLFTSLSFLTIETSFGQATDFTTNDCNGVSHHLFSELDAGHVIIIAWVMPCAPCATYSLPAYAATQSFATSHPGRVHFYMADDYANTVCATLGNWANSNSMPNSTTFSSSAVNMNGYGTAGMPKVVVLGGSNHTIFYNQNDSHISFNSVQSAISNALAAPLSINKQKNSHLELYASPNPAQDGILSVSYTIDRIEKITFDIVNILGEIVLTLDDQLPQTIGLYNNTFDISILTNGTYFLRFSMLSYTQTLRFVVTQ